jgi:hypothetical protein
MAMLLRTRNSCHGKAEIVNTNKGNWQSCFGRHLPGHRAVYRSKPENQGCQLFFLDAAKEHAFMKTLVDALDNGHTSCGKAETSVGGYRKDTIERKEGNGVSGEEGGYGHNAFLQHEPLAKTVKDRKIDAYFGRTLFCADGTKPKLLTTTAPCQENIFQQEGRSTQQKNVSNRKTRIVVTDFCKEDHW